MKMIRGLKHLSYEDKLRVGVVQPAKEKVFKAVLQQSWRGTFYKIKL